ncbi:hypothetical protein DLAC_03945 [Tieghemostelium lacteum]|uniref:Uncharacterized protein n=1 Tax=Tieghemostelium lacteum TaxID=361077 RepID=A0A151ZRW4_TIELA|nr:hypothetical protein DLAC_03945 [Tieghemostelium lacteum]|eukprot:KYQ96659.1 hypothetical protein DLAC_03945 [Tieghemostelium lacteum]
MTTKNNSEKDCEKCQYIYKNLLSMYTKKDNSTPASFFIREILEETPKCDKFGDLSGVRNAYENKLNSFDDKKEIVGRIKVLKNTIEDENAVIATAFHYNEWTQDKLLDCLSTKNYLIYQFTIKFERISAMVGRLAIGYVGFKGAQRLSKNSFKYLRKNIKD